MVLKTGLNRLVGLVRLGTSACTVQFFLKIKNCKKYDENQELIVQPEKTETSPVRPVLKQFDEDNKTWSFGSKSVSFPTNLAISRRQK